ncbi:hypothetical protein [Bacteroides sp. 224]|uniref:hypothetical protein n=1 Tax=Bacteroides sp. 224 TaxID=2302936 RepID=UPI0013D21426|nr:hypothetical protein [Bacteroides sp. 224]
MDRRKTTIFMIVTVLLLCAVPQANAQKRGRVETVLKNLCDNKQKQFQKKRGKLDEKTSLAFATELVLIDALDNIWNKGDISSIPVYYEYYVKNTHTTFHMMCRETKTSMDDIRNKTDEIILGFLQDSKQPLTFSRELINNVRRANYPLKTEDMQLFLDTRETKLRESMEKDPQINTCKLYFAEFPDGKYEREMKVMHNAILYKTVQELPTEENFENYFAEASLNDYFGSLDDRMYSEDARRLYAEYLFKFISESKDPSVARKFIDKYNTTPYLRSQDKRNPDSLEYITNRVDFDILASVVKAPSDLILIADYLKTHRYKEFREKASGLRASFERELLWTAPTYKKTYTNNRLTRLEEMDLNKTTTSTYKYNSYGKVISSTSKVKEMGKTNNYYTTYYYDSRGRCAVERQIDTKTSKMVYRRSRVFGPEGEIYVDSTAYATGRLILRKYDKVGNLTTEFEFNKLGEKVSMQFNKYNDKGVLVESERQFAVSKDKILAATVVSQIDEYEYDKYGYLTKITSKKTLGSSDKITTVATFQYDEYGNEVDDKSYYKYDHTGRWIQKTDKTNSMNMERIQITYNQYMIR